MSVKNIMKLLITAIFILSSILASSFTIEAGYGEGFDSNYDCGPNHHLMPVFCAFDDPDENDWFADDQSSLLCYKSVVELGNPLPLACAAMGWTVEDLHAIDPVKVFGYLVRLVLSEKGRYNVCLVTPSVCRRTTSQ